MLRSIGVLEMELGEAWHGHGIWSISVFLTSTLSRLRLHPLLFLTPSHNLQHVPVNLSTGNFVGSVFFINILCYPLPS